MYTCSYATALLIRSERAESMSTALHDACYCKPSGCDQDSIMQGKNLSFFQQKSLRVRRLYDTKRNTVIYIAYSTRLTSASDEGGASTGRYK